MNKYVFLLLLSVPVFAGREPPTLAWPLYDEYYGYLEVSEGFGPRHKTTTNGQNGYKNWFHYGIDMGGITGPGISPRVAYPIDALYGDRWKNCWVKLISEPSGDAQWIVLERYTNPEWIHWPTLIPPPMQIIYTHIDNISTIEVGKEYPGQASLAPITIKHPNDRYTPHLHFETTTRAYATPQMGKDRPKVTENPIRYLYYDESKCSQNEYSHAFGSDANGQYVKFTVKMHHDCLTFNKIDLNLEGGTWNWHFPYPTGGINGTATIDLNTRTGAILQNHSNDPGSPTREFFNNRYFMGEKMNAHLTPDFRNRKIKAIRDYYIYYAMPEAPTHFSYRMYDVYGNMVASKSRAVWDGVCVGCTPPSDAPQPPMDLYAQQTSNGILLSWDNIFENMYTNIYRREYDTQSPLDAVSIGMSSTNTFLDDKQYSSPGMKYLYSAANINLSEGCNGPLISSPCTVPPGQTCFEACPFTEIVQQMPSVPFPTSGLKFTRSASTKMVFSKIGDTGIKGDKYTISYSGLRFKLNGKTMICLTKSGNLVFDGDYDNGQSDKSGLNIISKSGTKIFVSYDKTISTNGPGKLNQYSL